MKILARTTTDVTIAREFTGEFDCKLPDVHSYQTLILEYNQKLFEDIVNSGVGRCTVWKECILVTVNLKELVWLKQTVTKTSLGKLGS